MKSGPTSFVVRSRFMSLCSRTVLALIATGCSTGPRATGFARSPTAGDDGAALARAGRTREAFVAYLGSCEATSAWDAADHGRAACTAAFALRAEATTGELSRWRDVAHGVCAGAPSPASIGVCRGVAELSLSGPLEDASLARDALSHGCHVHADYAACVRLNALGGGVRVASRGRHTG